MKNIEKISVSKLNQLVNKNIFIGKMNINQLREIIKYSSRDPNPNDPFEDGFENTKKDYEHYQRVKNSDRAYQIKLFFLKHIWNKYNFKEKRISPLGTFPSSIIISLHSNQDIESFDDYKLYLESEDTPEFVYINEEKEIFIPKSEQALIVDGQHRIAGLDLLLEEVEKQNIKINKSNLNDYYLDQKTKPPYNEILREVNSFEFIVTFLVDFDPYEQAEIFATVNFNQTKVNKSFYYDIFGSSINLTVEKLLHDITSHLNYKEDSPLYEKIKMLGSGVGYLSQSFIVDAMLPHFKNGTFYFIYDDFKNKGSIYKDSPRFLKIYFDVVLNKIFPEYMPKKDEKYKDVLLKTTGMGAIIKLLPNVFLEIKKRNKLISSDLVLSLDSSKLEAELLSIFDEVKNKGYEYFSENSGFAKGAGKGLQNRLYNKMFQDLGFMKKDVNNDDQLTLL